MLYHIIIKNDHMRYVNVPVDDTKQGEEIQDKIDILLTTLKVFGYRVFPVVKSNYQLGLISFTDPDSGNNGKLRIERGANGFYTDYEYHTRDWIHRNYTNDPKELVDLISELMRNL